MTLSELSLLCERATKAPWRSVRNSQRPYKHVIFDGKPDRDATYTTSPLEAADADFIAAARTWLPTLIEVAEAAQHLLYGPGITDIGCDGVCYSLVQIDTMLWIECVGCGKKKMLNSNDLHSHTVDCLVLRAEAALARLDETGRP